MTKYANQSDTVRIFEAYDSLPAQLAKDTKKFQYKLIKSGARASQYGDAIDWLIRSGIVNKCERCSQGFYPVAAYQDVTAFKLYYSDMGILSARMGMTLKAKSMMVYMEKYEPAYAIRISTRNFGMIKGIKSVPLYSVFCI